MNVILAEAGQNGLALEVHESGRWRRQRTHFLVRAAGDEAPVPDGDRFHDLELLVHRDDLAVEVDDVGLESRCQEGEGEDCGGHGSTFLGGLDGPILPRQGMRDYITAIK